MATQRAQYTIMLDIEASDQSLARINDIERSLKNLSDTAKSGDLKAGLAGADEIAKKLANDLHAMATSGGDMTAEMNTFNRSAERAINDLQRQAVTIQHSLSEQGKAQRERLATLKREKSALGESTADRRRAKEIEKEIAKIEKDVVDLSDEDLQNALAQNQAIRARLRLTQQEARQANATQRANKSFLSYAKDDLKLLKEKIKEQFKFIQALRTTEGRYKAIKKAAATVGRGAAGAVKLGAVGAAGILGLSAAAMGSAEGMVERERQAARIKMGIKDSEKRDLLGDLYIRTGQDYGTIVDAINRVVNVLGSGASVDEIRSAAIAEIRYPGAAAMYMQQTANPASAQDFTAYANRMKAVQSTTGASVEQITQTTGKIANMRQNSFSNANMADLLEVYVGLQNSGAFDTDEELDRAFRAFVREQKGSDKDVYTLAREWQESGRWERTAYGATNKTQVRNAIKSVDFKQMARDSRTTDYVSKLTPAEQAAAKMREIEDKKNRILEKLVDALAPVLDSIDVEALSGFISDIIQKVMPLISSIATGIGDVIRAVKAFYFKYLASNDEKDDYGVGQPHANGGIVSMPTLAGEAGPEMVIPLDYSRRQRGIVLTQNLNQHFNMSGSETTALSLAAVVGSRDFGRAMSNAAFLAGRV